MLVSGDAQKRNGGRGDKSQPREAPMWVAAQRSDGGSRDSDGEGARDVAGRERRVLVFVEVVGNDNRRVGFRTCACEGPLPRGRNLDPRSRSRAQSPRPSLTTAKSWKKRRARAREPRTRAVRIHPSSVPSNNAGGTPRAKTSLAISAGRFVSPGWLGALRARRARKSNRPGRRPPRLARVEKP